jgi:periplasmic protein TonB
MPKPLRTTDPNPPSVAFRDFGVLNDGTRSKSATITSIAVNVLIALAVLFLVKAAVVKPKTKHAELIDPVTMAKPEPPPPPKPKIKLPPPPPPPPPVKLPPVPPPPVPVPPPPVPPPPVPAPPEPKPQPTPPPPKLTPAPPAPKAVNLMGMAAHVPNNDMHPSAVRLGAADNPLKPMTGPAVARVNMGVAGMPGMPGSNTGSGPRSVSMGMGSGSPTGQNLAATSPKAINGLANGCTGCNGPMNSKVRTVAMATAPVQPTLQQPQVKAVVAQAKPTLIYKPEPVYTEEARAMHLEGNVSVRIRVTAEGTVQVLGVVSGLGHGLDQAAEKAAEGTRFKPAMDASGAPVPWEGVVLVKFQMS